MEFKEALNPIRALKSTFETMNLQPAHLWGGAILLMFVEQLTGLGFQFIQPALLVSMESGAGPDKAFGFLVCGACTAAVGFTLLATWLMPGLYLNFRSTHQTGETAEQGIFDAQGKFVTVLLTRILVGLSAIVLMIPGILLVFGSIFLGIAIGVDSPGFGIAVTIVGVLASYALMFFCVAGLMFSECAVIFNRFRPTEAIGHSWRLASGYRWRIALFFFVNNIFALLGLLMCCVGVLATAAVARLATAEAYLSFTSAGKEPSPVAEGDEPSPVEEEDEPSHVGEEDDPARRVHLD